MTAAQFRLCASRINPAFRVETGAVAEAYHALLSAAEMAEELDGRHACVGDPRGGTMRAQPAGCANTPPAAEHDACNGGDDA